MGIGGVLIMSDFNFLILCLLFFRSIINGLFFLLYLFNTLLT